MLRRLISWRKIMAGSFRDRKYYLCYPPAFNKQSAWDIALADGDITARHDQNTKTYPTIEEGLEDDLDCAGEYITGQTLLSRLFRLPIGFNGTPTQFAGWLAYAYGAAAVSGSQANEVQTATDATIDGGSASISIVIDNKSYTTAAVAYDALAAAWQSALEAVLGTGNVSVSGTLATGLAVTYQGDLQRIDLPLATFSAGFTASASPVTPVFVQSTAGSQYSHAITRGTDDQPPQTSLIYGFIGDVTKPLKAKNVVVNSWRITGTARQKVLLEIDLIGSGNQNEVDGYAVPACVNDGDLRTADCLLKINGVWYRPREFSFEYQNNIFSGDDAFAFDDIDPTRLERGDRRSTLTLQIPGSRGDALATLAESGATVEAELHLGKPNDRLSIYMPKLQIRKGSPFIGFAGEANRSVLNLSCVPTFDPLTAGTPDNAIALIGTNTAFLGS